VVVDPRALSSPDFEEKVAAKKNRDEQADQPVGQVAQNEGDENIIGIAAANARLDGLQEGPAFRARGLGARVGGERRGAGGGGGGDIAGVPGLQPDFQLPLLVSVGAVEFSLERRQFCRWSRAPPAGATRSG